MSIRWTGGDLLPPGPCRTIVNVLTENPDMYGRIDHECLEIEHLDDIVFLEE